MQQINLYTDELKPKREPVSAGRSLMVIVLAVFAMVAFTVWQQLQVEQIRHSVLALETQHQQLNDRAEHLRQTPVEESAGANAVQLMELHLAVKNREQLAKLVTGRSLGNANGFSRYLNTVNEKLPEAIALSTITLNDGGQLAAFSGASTQVAIIPEFYHRLQATAAFSNTHLGGLNIVRQGSTHRFFIGEPLKENEQSERVQ